MVETAPPPNGVTEAVREALHALGPEFSDVALAAALEVLEVDDDALGDALKGLQSRGELERTGPDRWRFKAA